MKRLKVPLYAGSDKPQQPSRIVVHAMGEFIDGKHAIDFLRKTGLSAHSLISPEGYNFRCRKDFEGAWHAKGYNTDSLGIEVLVPGNHNYETFLEAIQTHYMTGVQFESVIEQVREWTRLHDIEHIDRHSDLDPGRKKDPGDGFPWVEFRQAI